MSARKKLLILDLDNTLYDWVTYYARSFRAMIDVLQRLSGCDRNVLISEFKAIHQKYHTSEYSFSIQELPAIVKSNPGKSPEKIIALYWSAVETFRQVREQQLRLYPGVQATIRTLKDTGITIVGHSDAMEYYAVKRLQRLGLAPFFDCLYTAEGHPVPSHFRATKSVNDTNQELSIPVRTLPVDQHKPNPAILSKIISDYSLSPSASVFVGDSLNRDVYMALQVGVFAVWARYGLSFSPQDFSLLVAITHWTQEDIKREIANDEEIKPSLIVDRFSDITHLFES